MTLRRVHLRTASGSNACRATMLNPPVSDDPSKVTCSQCLKKFRKHKTPEQLLAARRRGGRAAARLPECNTTFEPQQAVPLH